MALPDRSPSLLVVSGLHQVPRVFHGGESGSQSDTQADAVEGHFQAKSMHGAKAVNQAANWCGLELRYAHFNTERFPNALDTLDEWTQKRHQIVHRGVLVKMRRTEATEVVELVRSVGKSLNDRAIERYFVRT